MADTHDEWWDSLTEAEREAWKQMIAREAVRLFDECLVMVERPFAMMPGLGDG